jgi:D-lactate dehydrogenase
MSAGLDIVAHLCGLVGRRHVLTDATATIRFTQGYRCGGGACLAVVRPGTLVEMWRVLQACIGADAIVILQAANTGLTGGSTPYGEYDRPVVIISTLRLTGVRILSRGEQVVCLPGTTLHELERALRPLGREPHSVIGSSCIGASVVGGVCNNSGGALVKRGPAYTELALFARLGTAGKLELVNHLGIDLGQSPEEMLTCLDAGVSLDERLVATELRASDDAYSADVRDVNAPTPARFNADPRRLFEAAGSGGKVAVFAVRLDTFEPEVRTATFYIGTNAPEELGQLRRRMLTSSHSLPIAAEYMHRGAFDIAERYGKDMFLAIQALGTDRLGWLYGLKYTVDRAARHIKGMPDSCSDRILQALSRLFPTHMPRRMRAFREAFEHHLMLKVGRDAIEATRSLLDGMFPSRSGDYFHCSSREAEKAFRHRFVAAGAAIRYRAVHRDAVEDILALDVALRRDDRNWVERLPESLNRQVLHTLYYGHFFCHVFHQDYILRKGVDPIAFEHAVCATLDARGAEYPAEHNVGHLYQAKPALAAHYRSLDPRNVFNPGIGRLSKRRDWAH